MADLLVPLAAEGVEPGETPALPCDPADVPATPAQNRLWRLAGADPDAGLGNHAIAYRLRGRLDLPRLERALQELVRRHAALRTTFASEAGRLRGRVQATTPLRFEVTELADVEPEERDGELEWRLHDDAQAPVDPTRAPLLRAHLYRLDEQDWALLLVVHRLAADAASATILARDLFALYEGAPPAGAPIVSHADFAHWQVRALADARWAAQARYWQEALAQPPAPPDLPVDRPRAAGPVQAAGRRRRALSAPALNALQGLAAREGATPALAALAALFALLHLCTAQRDLVVAAPLTNRRHPGVKGTVGRFENTVLPRVAVAGQVSYRELLRRVRDAAAAALAHADLPVEAVVDELVRRQGASAAACCRASFRVADAATTPAPAGLAVAPLDLGAGALEHDWELELAQGADGFSAALSYNADLFDAQTIDHALERYADIVVAAARAPDAPLNALLAAPAAIGPRRPGGGAAGFAASELNQTLIARFREQVRRAPEQLALRTPETALTYAALDRRANRIARAILAADPAPGSRVALLFGHGANAIAAVLGALKAGKTYVPLDALYPEQRLAQIIDDAKAHAIVTDAASLARARALAQGRHAVVTIDDREDAEDPAVAVAPDAPAYIIYTSGSTGRPKGVVQSHRNVLHYIRAYVNCLRLSAGDRLSLLPSYSVDAGVMDVYGALLSGATLYPFDLKAMDFESLREHLRRERITVYHSTPTVFRFLADALADGAGLPDVRAVVLGGEPVVRNDVEACRDGVGAQCEFLNLYGATEASFTLEFLLTGDDPVPGRRVVPAGFPVEDTQVVLLDEDGDPTPVMGEIAIRSPHVALEYWGNPALSRETFPERAGARLYRTGDLGRYLPGGALEVLGRRDFQVKIRGYRVEIGEIEAVLAAHPAVERCGVVLRTEGVPEPQLAAFVVARAGAPAPAAPELRKHVLERLPDFMVPATFTVAASLPLTPTRKLDRRRLAQMAP